MSKFPLLRLLAAGAFVFFLDACDAPKKAVPTPTRPSTGQPGGRPSTTQPGTTPGTTTPTPTQPGKPNSGTGKPNRETYRLAVVLPFLTSQFDAVSGAVPEKSQMALQFYAGMQVALAEISQQPTAPNLVVDVLDCGTTDLDFQQVVTNPRLTQAQVVIGPTKSGQVAALAERTKVSRQILISPETPTAELTTQNPGFVQINPSLRAHCSTIVQHLRTQKKYTPDQVVLVAKQKEADRLPYFQDANAALGGGRFAEVIVPDASTNFDKVDLKKYLKAGRTTAFVLPSWAGQDWIVAFLSRLKTVRGSQRVEVYGMPQWLDYEHIEPELLADLNVHVTTAGRVDRQSEAVKTFEQKFYDQFGTVPDDDAFNGYDVTLWTAAMLGQYGLSFPEKMSANPSWYSTLRGGFYFRRSNPVGTADGQQTFDYVENIFVHLLKFDKYGFVPAVGE